MKLSSHLSNISGVIGIVIGVYLLVNFAFQTSTAPLSIFSILGVIGAIAAALAASWATVAISALLIGDLNSEADSPSRTWLAITYVASTASGVCVFLLALGLFGPLVYLADIIGALIAVTVAVVFFLIAFRVISSRTKLTKRSEYLPVRAVYWGVVVLLILISAWVGDGVRDVLMHFAV